MTARIGLAGRDTGAAAAHAPSLAACEEARFAGIRAPRPEAARSLAEAVGRGGPHEIDAQRGLHVQQVIEAAEADLLGVETPSMVRHEAGSVVRPVRPQRR